jgi:hypothetical protein
MNQQPVDITFPFAGIDTGSSGSNPTPNTSRLARNVRPRDDRSGGKRRGSIRPGMLDLLNASLGGSIRDMVGLLTTGTQLSVTGTAFVDDFNQEASSSPGSLGDRHPASGTADYKLYVGTRAGINFPLGSSTTFTWSVASGGVYDSAWPEYSFVGKAIAVKDNVMAIGATEWPQESGDPSGAVLIYTRPGTGAAWSLFKIVSLLNVNTNGEDSTDSAFGAAVALDVRVTNEYNLVVGAPRYPAGTSRGRAFLFAVRPTLSPSDPASVQYVQDFGRGTNASTQFGFSVAIRGSLVLIGAPRELDGSINSGKVYVASTGQSGTLRSYGAPGAFGTLSASTNFGAQLALGETYAIVGAPGRFSAGEPNGAVAFYVVDLGAFTLTLDDTILGAGDERLGSSVAIDGTTAIAGAPHVGGTDGGTAYIYTRVGAGNWSEQQQIADTNVSTGHRFGTSVTLFGDTVVVGAPDTTEGGTNSAGRAVVFTRVGTTWTQGETLVDPVPQQNARFGGNALVLTSESELYVGVPDYNASALILDSGIVHRFTSTEVKSGGPFVSVTDGEGRVVDQEDYVTLGVEPTTYMALCKATSAAIGSLTRYGLSIRFKTTAIIGDKQGVVGLCCFCDESALDANQTDRSAIVTISRFLGSSSVVVSGVLNRVGSLNGVTQESFATWTADTEYELRLLVDGTFGELYLITGGVTTKLAVIDNLRASGSTIGDIDDTGIAFIFGSSGDNSNEFFQWIDDFRVLNVDRQELQSSSKVVAIAGNSLVAADSSGTISISSGQGSISSPANSMLLRGPSQSASGGEEYVYVLDGTRYRKINIKTLNASTWTPTSGSLPLATGSYPACRWGVEWRNRCVLFGNSSNPDVFYMSRAGNWDDWNFTPALGNRNGREPIAANNSRAGIPSQPISCVFPFSADLMAIASTRRMWMLVGDPAINGSLDVVTAETGIVGPRAWATDEEGNAYFWGIAGLFLLPAGSSSPINLTKSRLSSGDIPSFGRMRRFAEAIDHDTYEVRLKWSRRFDGLHVFLATKDGSPASVEHLFWDRANDAFFVDTFPIQVASAAEFIPTGQQPQVVVGGSDGKIRYFDEDSSTDGDLPIAATYVTPSLVSQSSDRVSIGRTDIVLGAVTDAARFEWLASEDPESLESEEPFVSLTLEGTQMHCVHERCSGASVALRVSSVEGSTLSIDRITAHVEMHGPVYPAGRSK